MSKFRSASPSNTTNTLASIKSTITSRPQSHDYNTPSVSAFGERSQLLTSRHSSYPISLRQSTRASTQPLPSTETSTERSMAGNPHVLSLRRRGRPEARSSPSSDSQDELMDTDDQQGKPLEVPATVAQPKKKRTRTLTTPHQSSVLYALLAQSRFPSTSVREEVGRSIGLSARKVQIWFQNQRQKARRPQSQSETSRKRAPQYGSSPNIPITSSDSSYSFPEPGQSSRITQLPQAGSVGLDQPGYGGYHSDPPSRLSGPGIPGSDSQVVPPYRGRPNITSIPGLEIDIPHTSSSSPYFGSHERFAGFPSPSSVPSPPIRHTQTTVSHSREFSRALPPLSDFPPSRSTSPVPRPPSGSYLSSSHLGMLRFPDRLSLSPKGLLAHRPLAVESRTLPPLYTVQPTSRREVLNTPPALGFPVYLRNSTDSLPASRTHTPSVRSSGEGQTTTTTPESGRDKRSSASPSEPSPPSQARPGRYDPVRATFIYTNPSEQP